MTDRIYYADDEILSKLNDDFQLVEQRGWHMLYQSKKDNTYWRLDTPDKYQQQYLVKIDNTEQWDEFDDSDLRIELLKQTRGVGDSHCIWGKCGRQALRGLVYCEQHAYKEMGIRR